MKDIKQGCCASYTLWNLIEQCDKSNKFNDRRSREQCACCSERCCTFGSTLCFPCCVKRGGNNISQWVFSGGIAEQTLRKFEKSFDLVKTLEKIHRAELVAQSILEPHQRFLTKFQRRLLIDKSDATSSSEDYTELLNDESMKIVQKELLERLVHG